MELKPDVDFVDQMLLLISNSKQEYLSFNDLARGLSHRANALLCLTLSVPFILPIPLPGLSSVVGVFVLATAIAMLLDRPPWLPFSFGNRKLSREKLNQFVLRAVPRLRMMDRFLRPRMLHMVSSHSMVRVHGALIAVMALLLISPGPPGYNFLPSLSIVCLSLAIIKDDGLMSLFGSLLSVGAVTLFAATYYFAVDWLVKFLA